MKRMKHISKYPGHLFRGVAKAFVILNLGFLLCSCEKVFEAYVGLPLQPTNINSVYVPGLNVFGVLKAGSIVDTSNHFFEVHFIPHVFDTIDISIYEADISLQIDSNTYNLNHFGNGLYFNSELAPMPGQEWNYSCVYDTFEVTSQTIIPNTPVVNTNTIEINDGSLALTIDYDASAYMYDVYYYDGYSFESKRIVPGNGNDIEVQLDIEYNEESAISLLYVIAYDQKYERYISTSNIFFKPNAYRPRFTTVDGGYGCFGSLCSLEIDLKK